MTAVTGRGTGNKSRGGLYPKLGFYTHQLSGLGEGISFTPSQPQLGAHTALEPTGLRASLPEQALPTLLLTAFGAKASKL